MPDTIFDHYYHNTEELRKLNEQLPPVKAKYDSCKGMLKDSVYSKQIENFTIAELEFNNLQNKINHLSQETDELKGKMFTFFEQNPGVKEVIIEHGANIVPTGLRPDFENNKIECYGRM